MARNWRNRWWNFRRRNACCRSVAGYWAQWSTINFNAEQAIQLFAIACEDPQASGRPISQWTARVSSRDEKTGHRREHLGATCGAITLKLRVETTPDSLLVNPPLWTSSLRTKSTTLLTSTAAARALQRAHSMYWWNDRDSSALCAKRQTYPQTRKSATQSLSMSVGTQTLIPTLM